mmetsp:Transcript_8987/g.13200  ORF Transcript_8987/g.13200 Transcript_8987/m.13200 type:complete len:240 (+) Transcript_8987:109-828(+)
MPLMICLPFLQLGTPVQPILHCNLLQRLQNRWHHTLQTTEVNRSTIVQFIKELLRILCNDMLYIKLSSINAISHLTRNSIINLELIGILEHSIKFLLIQQPPTHRNAKDQPCSPAEHVPCYSLLHEQPVHEASERSDASSGRYHDNIIVGVWGEEHGLTYRSSNVNFHPRCGVAKHVAAYALLGWIGQSCHGIVILCAPNAKTHGIPIKCIAITRRSDRIEPWREAFVIFRVNARRDDR